MKGSCFCGNLQVESTGEVQAKALCHCTDCRKITGSTYSTNLIVPGDGFSVTKGTPKTISKKADSGSNITSFFCGDCGSTIWRETPSFEGAKIIKAGVLDGPNALDDAKPALELFAAERVPWVQAVSGADQKTTMT